MAKKIEHDGLKRNSRKETSGDVKGILDQQALKEVPAGTENHGAPFDRRTADIVLDRGSDLGTTTYEEPSHTLAGNLPVQEVPGEGAQLRLIPAEKFKEQIDGLRQSGTIKNDKGEEVTFEGETKEEFIKFCEKGYTVIEKMMAAVYETGKFLYEVRKVLKPKRLFLTWMNFTGLQERRSYRYLKVYERFGDKLSAFSHLGIRKLLAASHLKNCVEYLDEHREEAEKQTAEQFEQAVRKVLAGKKKRGGGRKPSYEDIAGCKVRRSEDGSRLVIEGLSKKRQEELFDAIKALLLDEKG